MVSITNVQTATCYGPTIQRNPFKYNSAIRLSYSLQLLPCYNEKLQLTPIYPLPGISNPAAASKQLRSMRNRLHHGNNNNRSMFPPESRDTNSYSILWLPLVFVVATMALYGLSRTFLHTVGNSHLLKFPTSIDDIQDMTDFLLAAKDNHLLALFLLFSAAYIYKQSFAIPGSVFMNLLAGALYGPYIAFALTCTLTSIGATSCYMMSRLFGKAYVVKYFPDRVKFFEEKVESNKDSLFFFLLFLRLFPLSPNWAINLISPIVGVPVHYFFASMFIGLMPYNFVCVQTGSVLSQISSVNDILDIWTMAKMATVALVALMPGVLIKRFHIKQD